jgi:transposase
MDCAYEGNETRALVRKLGYKPVVPPNPRRRKRWKLDKRCYKCRNVVERLFRRIKGFRRLATRYDKLDVMFAAYVRLALIFIALN